MSHRNERRIRIIHNDGKVASLPMSQADNLVDEGKASFLSRTLYKAAKAGLDLNKIKDKRDDRAIKVLIAAQVEKQEKAEKKRQKQERKKKREKKERRAKEAQDGS